MNHYGTPPACIPATIAAEAAEMTRDELLAALGAKVIKVGIDKYGVLPADLEAESEGASEGLALVNPAFSASGQDLSQW